MFLAIAHTKTDIILNESWEKQMQIYSVGALSGVMVSKRDK